MIAGTSTVSATTWPSVMSTRTSEPPLSFPTIFSSSHLQARDDQIPECCPNKVVIHLSTTVVIPDYGLYYSVPIESFRPTYYAYDDGSLIAPPFIQDLVGANISLLVTGFIAMLFVRNIIVTGDYIRRGKVKNKTLFHILFLSQILAPISFVPIIISYFNQLLNCTTVIILSCVAGTLSLALLITGILGVKVYKCLNNSRFILIVLGIFQCASSGTIAMDVATMRGERRLSGSCVRVSNLLCTRIFVLIQLFESLFICCCFMYACWKSRGSTDARGRISIQLSMEELPIEIPEDTAEKPATLRGWWDYVPNTQVVPVRQPSSNLKQASTRRPRLFLTGFFRGKAQKPRSTAPKHPRHRTSETPSDRHLIIHHDRTIYPHGRTSPTPSSLSRLGKLVPHMELFQKVMKDELLYTTFITGTCVVVAVLAVIGVNFKNGLTVSGWIALNWSVISLLAIHSFGRVVRRHERDALLQHPATCDAIVRRGNAIASARLSNRSKSRTSSEFSTNLGLRGNTDNDTENPFSDARRLNNFRLSWHTPGFAPSIPNSTPPSNLPVSENPRTSPVFSSSPTSSSIYSTFPTSGRGTPIVPHQSSDGASEFSQSWLLDRVSLSTNGDG
ncbi:hypothetical protein BDZ94DRAFT_1275389 [Collybia nuda]|uniref:Uncharacterized protein n=1 Tax=Collybia nuda TaxID=64659 RepID=A0A9P5XT59_9AGAR|nr:hypothetical protein BDZ94DRAFT_1275389 [Collybia nuda]